MEHVEFFHRDHFEWHYHRKKPGRGLGNFIDFFWETNFDELFQKHPNGFSDALFPNVGYTYLINLGTPFTMQLEEEHFELKSDGFLPRSKYMICHHSKGNKIFGIKFKVSPVVFEKKVNFSEYSEYIFPLAYLIERQLSDKLKAAESFERRVQLVSEYYTRIIDRYAGALQHVDVVTRILKECYYNHQFDTSITTIADQYKVSSRTLQRYFESAIGISCKQALQIMRIRKALEDITTEPRLFHYANYGYYDYSHFYKHLRSFVNSHSIKVMQPHLQLLKKLNTCHDV